MGGEALGVGTDIIDVARVASLIDRNGDRFLSRWFTPAEVTYCQEKTHPEQHLAARLAAKEATVKAIRARWDRTPWQDIEIIKGRGGALELDVRGQVLRQADERGIRKFLLSISHCDSFATATVIAIG